MSTKAILVVSFGTSHNDTREKTIDVMEAQIARAYPEHRVYRAWTSKIIIRKLKTRDNTEIFTVSEAMEQMLADGILDVAVQPTHIINGIENDQMKQEVLGFREKFASICFGEPLLSSDQDNVSVIRGLMEEYERLGQDEALVFMGHGTNHYVNTVYAALDYTFKDMGYTNVYVGTVEAYPSMETILKKVVESMPSKVILVPFMFVAGDHAKNDMSSEEEDSWRSRFEKAGFSVECVLKGLGEYKKVRGLLMEHLRQAMGEQNGEAQTSDPLRAE